MRWLYFHITQYKFWDASLTAYHSAIFLPQNFVWNEALIYRTWSYFDCFLSKGKLIKHFQILNPNFQAALNINQQSSQEIIFSCNQIHGEENIMSGILALCNT